MPTKKAAETDCKSMNVYQKLAAARRMFLDAEGVQERRQRHLEFEYFELDDIIPRRCASSRRSACSSAPPSPSERVRDIDPFTGAVVETVKPALIKAEVVNVDKPEERMRVPARLAEPPPIKNRDGHVTSNPLQQLGSEQTYVRRYIKQQVLDICEPDETDAFARQGPGARQERRGQRRQGRARREAGGQEGPGEEGREQGQTRRVRRARRDRQEAGGRRRRRDLPAGPPAKKNAIRKAKEACSE